jgi:hypothetical protein
MKVSISIISAAKMEAIAGSTLKITVFSDVASCSLLEINRRFRDAYWINNLALITLMMEAVVISETSINF